MIAQAENDSQDRGLSAPHAKEIASPLTQVDPRKRPLTRQVLSSTVTIRLGGGCAAPRRQIKLTLTAAFESPIPKACALNALQPPPSTNWNKWNKRQLRPPPNKEGKKSKRFAERRF
jgi:hypothetical protein